MLKSCMTRAINVEQIIFLYNMREIWINKCKVPGLKLLEVKTLD